MSNLSVKYLLKAVHHLSPPLRYIDKPAFVTIGFSHFCERARWVLDLSPLDYHEIAHGPALHLSSTLMELSSYPRLNVIGKIESDGKLCSSSTLSNSATNSTQQKKLLDRKELTSVPKLIVSTSSIPDDYKPFIEHKIVSTASTHYSGPVVVKDGSTGIMQYLADQYPDELHFLYPSKAREDICDIENFIISELALEVTKWLFGNVILTGKDFDSDCHNMTNVVARKKFLQICTSAPIPLVEKAVLSIAGERMIVPLMIKNNDVSPASRNASQHKILKVLDQLEERQQGKGKYLLNTSSFSAADITLASLLYPAVVPSETSRYFCSMEELQGFDSPGAANIVNFSLLLREKYKVVQNTLELYASHRWTKK